MLYSLIMAMGLITVCWLWGYVVLKLLNYEGKLILFEISIGYALMILVLNLLYFKLDMSIVGIKAVVIVLSAAGIVYLIKKGVGKRSFSSLIYVMLFFSLFACLGFISYWRGYGENFYVFRANVDDNFNYINMSYAIYKHKFSYYLNASADILYAESDILAKGASLINLRPSVNLPFALMLQTGKGSIFFSAYLYMSVLYSFLAPALYRFWKKLAERKSPIVRNLLLASYMLGFWGQLSFDINAWSQLGGMPILFTTLYLVILKLEGEINWWELIPLVSAAFLIYPEASMVYAAGVGVFLFLYYLLRKDMRKLKHIAGWFIIVLCAVGLMIIVSLNYKTLFAFMKEQLYTGATTSVRWFSTYWDGRHPSDSPVLNAANHIISFFWLLFFDAFNWKKHYDIC